MTRITYIPNRIIDSDGIADGATVYVYQSGTTTPVSLFSDENLSVPTANPFTVASGAAFPEVYHNYSGDIRLYIVSTLIQDIDPYILFDSTQVTYKSTLTGAVSRNIKAKFEELAISVKDFGATGDGTTDDTAAIQAALDTGAKLIYFPPGQYKVTSTLQLTRGQTVFGPRQNNMNSFVAATENTQSAVILFRPAGADTLFINKVDAYPDFDSEAIGFEDLVLDGAANTSFGIALTSCYSPSIRRVNFRGTWDVCIFMTNTYGAVIEDVATNGASIKHNVIFLGSQNATVIRRLHTSNAPNDAAVPLVGVAISSGSGVRIDDCQFQGVSIGIDVNTATRTLVTNPYFENALSFARVGISGTISQHFHVVGGTYEPVVSTHSQYASRGPGFYLKSARGFKLDSVSFGTSNATDASFWPIVLGSLDGASSGSGIITNCECLGSQTILNNINRTSASNWGLYMEVLETDGDKFVSETVRKASDVYNSTHVRSSVNSAGTEAFTAWTPATTVTVSALLDTAFYTPVVP